MKLLFTAILTIKYNGHIYAESPYTVAGESYSAGRLYDKIGDTAEGTVLYVLPKGVLCYVNEESLLTSAVERNE